MQNRVEKLAERLLAERAEMAVRERERRKSPPIGSDFDPFEFGRGRVVAGGDPGYMPGAMRKGATGFHVACQCCGSQFESRGWAYCGTCLEMPAEERRAVKPVASGRLCEAPGCEKFVPRRARANVRYCSRACQVRAYRAKNVHG